MFITTSSSPHDWRSPQNNNLWQGKNGINNPCPEGWRLPTEAELNSEFQSWGSSNSTGAYASTLKWPVDGYRFYDGDLYNVGSFGAAWASSISGNNASRLTWYNAAANMSSANRAVGKSVRCILDN